MSGDSLLIRSSKPLWSSLLFKRGISPEVQEEIVTTQAFLLHHKVTKGRALELTIDVPRDELQRVRPATVALRCWACRRFAVFVFYCLPLSR